MVATTTNAQPTMESASQLNNLPMAPAAAVISEQPKSNPMSPTVQPPTNNNQFQTMQQEEEDQNIGLRGGWMTIGKHFNCCGLNCGFSKTF
ncbi:hypothetical protein B0T20DRAFT_151320 [Sordaria brevicollis]|uniref:Uncharacterized protein n=1 Tax=Sordaria brevicollis TaxID=83679 RepID=A0AAE0UDY8_SORBR|nr:hypothetical protein B0T20DRAFT_151320 [Sordaria brevicollis]